MNYDDVLRALVDRAWMARGTDGYDATCQEIVSMHTRWPMIEYHLAAAKAEEELARGPRRIELAIEALRESYAQ